MQPLLLDLRHYETVVAIVEFGTMTEAAGHLSLSQSALSHRLADAERRLGTRLFDRGRDRRLSPTRDGLAVHQVATRSLAQLGRLEAHLVRSPAVAHTTVRIAVGSYDCYHWFPDFLTEVRRNLPQVDLDLVVIGDDPGSALASRAVDIVVAPGRPEGPIDLRPLFEDELVLVVAPDHRLADAASIRAEDLVEETYLTYNARPTPGFEYDRFIRPAEAYPRVVRVVCQTSAIVELVAAGVGVAILSRWALAPALAAGRIRAVPCGGSGLPLVWQAVTRAGDPSTSAVVDELSRHLARTG